MAVMASGNIIVGKSSSTPKSRPVSPENLAKRAYASPPAASTPGKAEGHCGAMSQQRGDSGGVSTPQKFVRLVGCRDGKTRPSGGN
jgi:hypothetical protein